MEYYTSGFSGKIYKYKNKIIKKIIINSENIKKIKSEILFLQKINHELWSPTLYNIKIVNNIVYIIMEKLEKTMCEWVKENNNWKSFYRQLFTILYKLHSIYNTHHNDVHCGNLMWKGNRLYLIDYGSISNYRSKKDFYDYNVFLNIYKNNYSVNSQSIWHYLNENVDKSVLKKYVKNEPKPKMVWKIVGNYKLLNAIINDLNIDLSKIPNSFKFPDEIINYVKQLSADYGISAKEYLIKYFPEQWKLIKLSELQLNEKDGIINENWNNVNELNNVIDEYSFHCRMKCRIGKLSPEEYKLQKNTNWKSAIKTVGVCTNFNISRVILLFKYLFPHKNMHEIKWLDPSAGWGSRLMGAIALGIKKYRGIDPNSCLSPVYNRIIDELGNGGDYKVWKGGFEDYKVDDKYDIVFTSPPFYDYEIYSNNKNQSVKLYNSEKEWINGFLINTIKKSIKSLKKNGYLVLYIESKNNIQYTKIFNKFNIIYMKYDDDTTKRPFYIFKNDTNL